MFSTNFKNLKQMRAEFSSDEEKYEYDSDEDDRYGSSCREEDIVVEMRI